MAQKAKLRTRLFAAILVLGAVSNAKPPEGYEIIGYTQPPNETQPTFTILHGEIKITARCENYYGSRVGCSQLRDMVGKTVPWPKMMELSQDTLEYNPDNPTSCSNSKNCEFLNVIAKHAVP